MKLQNNTFTLIGSYSYGSWNLEKATEFVTLCCVIQDEKLRHGGFVSRATNEMVVWGG